MRRVPLYKMGPDMEVIAIHDINDAYCKVRFRYVIDRSILKANAGD